MKIKVLVIFLLILLINLFIGVVPSIFIAYFLIVTLVLCLSKYDWAFVFMLLGTVIGAYFANNGTRFIGVFCMIPSAVVLCSDLYKQVGKYMRIYLPMFIFILICFQSAFFTTGGNYSTVKLSAMVGNVIVYIIAFTHFVFFRWKHSPFYIAISICLLCLFMANYMNELMGTRMTLDTFLTSFAGFREAISEYRYHDEEALVINYQVLGMYGCLAMIFACMKDAVKTKFLFLFVIIVSFVIIIYSSARQAFVSTAVVFLLITIINSKSWLLRIGYLFVIFLCLFFWIYNLDSNSMSFLMGSAEGKGSVRSLIRNAAFSDFLSNPIYGIGFGRFFYDGKFGVNEHSLLIELLAETGLIGFVFFLFCLCRPIFYTLNRIKQNVISYMPYLCILIVYFIRFMVSSDLRESIILLIFVALLPYYYYNLNIKK